MQKNLKKIEQWLSPHKGAIVAFSGGVDSSLVLYLSRKFLGKDKTIGVISASESYKYSELLKAVDFCNKYDIEYKIIQTEELLDEDYYSNPHNRCYFCKNHLYEALEALKTVYPGYSIFNGTNKDDSDDYRPGHISASEHDVVSPLAEMDLSKNDIRDIAKYLDLEIWNKPSSPCLSTRIPYGSTITKEKLRQIEEAEETLNMNGFNDVRVRHYGNYCKVEVPQDRINDLQRNFSKISQNVLKLGFEKCLVDEEGLVSGKLNRDIGHAES